MTTNIRILFLLFFTYSFLGWLMEVINALIVEKKFINRGFLVGPYCPIYGTGVILITLLLKKYYDDIIATFIFSILICGILEYLTSYILEKIFNLRWWDYSDRKFNINGRICLSNLFIFGILGCTILYILNPFFIDLLSQIPEIVLNIICIILAICFVVDIGISSNVIVNLKKISNNVRKDNTEEISTKVKAIIQKKFSLQRRLLVAFPNIRKGINLEELIKKSKIRLNRLKEKQKKYIKDLINK